MKKLILLSVILILSISSYSQSGGPDQFGYTWRDSNHPQGPVFNWIDIDSLPGTISVTGLGDDNTAGMFPLGFQFQYYWYTVNEFLVGSNGYILFENGAIAQPFPALPSALLPNNVVAPFMTDLTFIGTGNTASCKYWSNNTDTLIVTYKDVPFWIQATAPALPYTGLNTFQIILSQVDSSITYQYLVQNGASPATTGIISIGIENNSGNIGLQHSFNTYPAINYAVKFYYPDTISFSVNDASTVYNDNVETGGIFLSKDGSPFTMTAQVKNTGNQTAAPFDVYFEFRNGATTLLLKDTLTTGSLAPGQTEILTSTKLFSPTIADIYTFNSTTKLVGDATISNDSKLMELDVVDTTQSLLRLGYTADFPVPPNSGVGWSGGDAGMGVEIAPPYTPCYIHYLEYYITANDSGAGFYALIFDNTGPNNGPGTLLDSFYVSPSQVTVGAWNSIAIPTPVLVNSGSVFVAWMMDGVSINLGLDNTFPISNRSYEILGGWAIYRDRENNDPMIRIQVSTSATAGTANLTEPDLVGNFFPSPTTDKVSIDVNFRNNGNDIKFEFYNIQGQYMGTKKFNRSIDLQSQRYTFNITDYNTGVYICKISSGNHSYTRKVIVQ